MASALAGADAVVNLAGILYSGGGQNFEELHAVGAGYVAGRLTAGEPQCLKAARKAVRKLSEAKPFW